MTQIRAIAYIMHQQNVQDHWIEQYTANSPNPAGKLYGIRYSGRQHDDSNVVR